MLDRRSVACAFGILHMPNRDAAVLVAPASLMSYLHLRSFCQSLLIERIRLKDVMSIFSNEIVQAQLIFQVHGTSPHHSHLLRR